MSHAVLSPSGAARWLACPPSARLEQQFPDTAGEAAREGTLAHALGECLIRYYTGKTGKAAFEKELSGIRADSMYNPDMEDYAEGYAAFVNERYTEACGRTKDAVLGIEEKLDLTEFVPEGYGTGDAIVIADGVLDIIDLKYGKGVPVYPENNRQMMLYALGALHGYGFLYDISVVRMTIYQPRLDNISSWELPAEELCRWAEEELRPRAKLAFEGKGEFCPGAHCRFCKAKAQCAALAGDNLRLARYEFRSAELLTDRDVSAILTVADRFRNWLSSVEDYALREAVNSGKKWEGFKLVEGRSNRVYTDPDKVAETLMAEGYPEALIYEKKLLGISAMEKTITKKVFACLPEGLIRKPPGAPVLVLLSDKRPEMGSTADAINDFSNN